MLAMCMIYKIPERNDLGLKDHVIEVLPFHNIKICTDFKILKVFFSARRDNRYIYAARIATAVTDSKPHA
jgi:hypothetical protein